MPAHAHSHDHEHHGHDHAHAHRDGEPAGMVSAMLMSAPARLGVAAGLIALLWGLVAWAMT